MSNIPGLVNRLRACPGAKLSPFMAAEPQRVYRFGVFEADVACGELRRNGSKVRLQEQPFQVLIALLERSGEVVTREELRQRLWPADTFVDFDHSLNTAINKVRDALGDGAVNPRFLETIPKKGYRFIAAVQRLGAEATPPAVAAPASGAVLEAEPLPVVHPLTGRILLGLLQVMYLCFYVAALAGLHDVAAIVEPAAPWADWPVMVAVLVSASLGIPVRLYLLTALSFDYARTGEKFLRLFPLVFLLDELWALSPFLLAPQIGLGLALAACATLLYVPFSQRTLMRMTYPVRKSAAAM